MTIRSGTLSYPGAGVIFGGEYTASHGITPGTAVLRVAFQTANLSPVGDLVISDGVGAVPVRSCRVENVRLDEDGAGPLLIVELADRRWRWRDCGYIDGCYNQLDPHGKLLPWSIRSPTELAILCLQALNETNYVINLPPGINYPGPNVFTPIINISGVNPPIDWKGIAPAQALANLADVFGCRVVYDPVTDAVYVGPYGIGKALPAGSVHRAGPAVQPPAVPDGLGVRGSPTRYQGLLLLEAVGEEWDGSYQPLKYLSYAPIMEGAAQVTTLTPGGTLVTDTEYQIVISVIDQNKNQQSGACTYESADNVLADICNGIVAAVNGSNDPSVQRVMATTNGTIVTLTAKKQNDPFDVDTFISGDGISANPPSTLIVNLTTVASPQQVTWDFCNPPFFKGVRATPRLTLLQAEALAQKSVWRCFRLSDYSAIDGKSPITIPGFGKLIRRQQILLQDTQVDQVVPTQPVPGAVVPGNLGVGGVPLPLLINYYNGYSRDKPAVVYGSVDRTILESHGYGVWAPQLGNGKLNTPFGTQVYLNFTIDPVLQVVTFSTYVYRLEGPNNNVTFNDPPLYLQTAMCVRDPVNNQLTPYLQIIPLPGSGTGNPLVRSYPDIQVEVTSDYSVNPFTNKWKLNSTSILDADPIARAGYYLDSMALQYQPGIGGTNDYNGILPCSLDGAITQVTWRVPGGGECCSTIASRIVEHHLYLPPYPARRRNEFLRPATFSQLNQQLLSKPWDASEAN